MIVDEATQCTEPHCLIPLCAKPSLFVLVGDSHQLAATIRNPTIKRLGYGKSLFERLLLNEYPRLSLRIQFRMAPPISLWPNRYVYQSRLIDSKRVRQPAFCYLFQHSSVPCFAFLDLPDVRFSNRCSLGALREASLQFFQSSRSRSHRRPHPSPLPPPAALRDRILHRRYHALHRAGASNPHAYRGGHRCREVRKGPQARQNQLCGRVSGRGERYYHTLLRPLHSQRCAFHQVGRLPLQPSQTQRGADASKASALDRRQRAAPADKLPLEVRSARAFQRRNLIESCKQRGAFFSVSAFMESFGGVQPVERVLASREVLRLFHDDGDYSQEIRGGHGGVESMIESEQNEKRNQKRLSEGGAESGTPKKQRSA